MDCQFPKLIKMMNSSVDCQTNIYIETMERDEKSCHIKKKVWRRGGRA